MNYEEIDKLKILANNHYDFFKMAIAKIKQIAIKNKHEMHLTGGDYWMNQIGVTSESFTLYCSKCSFYVEFDSQYDKRDGKGDLKLSGENINDKCCFRKYYGK